MPERNAFASMGYILTYHETILIKYPHAAR
jgi:hypothetical protein